jgi:hypothetical protein
MKYPVTTSGNAATIPGVATFNLGSKSASLSMANRVSALLEEDDTDAVPVDDDVDYSAEEDPVYFATHVRTESYVKSIGAVAALLKPTERQALLHGNGTAAVTKALAGAGLVVDGKRTELGDAVAAHLT